MTANCLWNKTEKTVPWKESVSIYSACRIKLSHSCGPSFSRHSAFTNFPIGNGTNTSRQWSNLAISSAFSTKTLEGTSWYARTYFSSINRGAAIFSQRSSVTSSVGSNTTCARRPVMRSTSAAAVLSRTKIVSISKRYFRYFFSSCTAILSPPKLAAYDLRFRQFDTNSKK